MPEVLPPSHPVALELKELGPEGLRVRATFAGTRPVSVCMFHGVHDLHVTYAMFVPDFGRFGKGKPVRVVQAVSMCYPQCGARIEWRS